MSHTDLEHEQRLEYAVLTCGLQGGYIISGVAASLGAFSTLPEALAWLARNMKQVQPPENRALNLTVAQIKANYHTDSDPIREWCPADFAAAADPIGSKAQ